MGSGGSCSCFLIARQVAERIKVTLYYGMAQKSVPNRGIVVPTELVELAGLYHIEFAFSLYVVSGMGGFS
jgi:hypothetical protein